MKKLMIVSLAAAGVALTAAPAMADHHAKPKVASWQKMDTNGNGTVSREEWIAGNRNPNGFDGGDANADGEMTRAEFDALRERWRQARERREAAGKQ